MSKLNNDVRQIFEQTLNGGVITTGNTCVVVGSINNKVREYIRAIQDPVPYTAVWDSMGSSAYLDIPEGSTIEYAVLEWHSTVANYILGRTMSAQYTPIYFTTPIETVRVSIETESSDEAIFTDGVSNKQSTKWADVTDIIKKGGMGFYSIKGIPTVEIVNQYWRLSNHDQAPGWSLTVVYRNSSSPLRNINIFIGLKQHTYSTTNEFNTLSISGFTIPQIPKNAYLIMVASNGDPDMYARVNVYSDLSLVNKNDLQYAIGNTVDSSSKDPKVGSIMPYDNLFSGIIMDTNTESANYGQIDTRGLFGQKNNSVFDILNQPKFEGNRGKMDILAFDISEKMIPDQQNLYLRIDLSKAPSARVQMITYATQIDL